METWLLYALLSMLFAGLTSVLAKVGLKEISPDLGLAIRTAVVFLIVSANAFIWKGFETVGNLSKRTILFLILSGLTTSLSWIFYYRAMKIGTVSYVATIDKGSILLTLLFSVMILGEPMTLKLIIGAALIIAGLLVLSLGN